MTTGSFGGVIIHGNKKEFAVEIVILLRAYAHGWWEEFTPFEAGFVEGDWSWESIDEYFDDENNFTITKEQLIVTNL